MKNLEFRVSEKLVSWGNNPKDVQRMVSTHFEYASSKYSGVIKIAEVIRSIY